MFEALRELAAVDDDLGRTLGELGHRPVVVTERSPVDAVAWVDGALGQARAAALPLLPAGYRPVLALDHLVLAFPVSRTLVLAAAGSSLVDLLLPRPVPGALHALLFERSALTLDQVTNVVDLTVDLLAEHLGVHPQGGDGALPGDGAHRPAAGVAGDGASLAAIDERLAAAARADPGGLAEAAAVTVAVFDELLNVAALVDRLGALGLTATAGLIRV